MGFAALAEAFDRRGYRLARVRRIGAVPRLFVAKLPPDMTVASTPAQRKALFIRIALPYILAVNEEIAAERARIVQLRDRLFADDPITPGQDRWLREMFVRRDLPMFDFDALLRRVDLIVPSVTLAQAAEESGWGTSRFAHQANALFGQRIFKGGKGLVPRSAAPGIRFRVRAFDSLLDSVRAYAANLNSHPAYRRFRSVRADDRRRGLALDGFALAGTLRLYSENRETYVATIKRIIRIDGLTDYDRARFGETVAELGVESER